MQFIAIPTEQTTAVTDAILGLEALALAFGFQRYLASDRFRARAWQALMLLTSAASFLGAVAHGFQMSRATYELLWQPLLLCLGLLVAALVLAAVIDLWGREAARRLWPWLLVVALGFYGVTFIPRVTFLVFVLYESLGMLFVLVAYAWLAFKGGLNGAWLVAAGVILQLTAAGAQAAGPFGFRLIWAFDHNGLFHLIGMAATLVMFLGVAKGFAKAGPAGRGR